MQKAGCTDPFQKSGKVNRTPPKDNEKSRSENGDKSKEMVVSHVTPPPSKSQTAEGRLGTLGDRKNPISSPLLRYLTPLAKPQEEPEKPPNASNKAATTEKTSTLQQDEENEPQHIKEFIQNVRKLEEDTLNKCIKTLDKLKKSMAKQGSTPLEVKKGVLELDTLLSITHSYRCQWVLFEKQNKNSNNAQYSIEGNQLANYRPKRLASSPIAAESKKLKETKAENCTEAKRADEAAEKWQTVTRRIKQRGKENKDEEKQIQIKNVAKKQQKNIRRRLEAVVVKPAQGRSYAETLKELRDNIAPEKDGIDIRAIRKTKGGDILLEVKKGGEKAKFCEAIKSALGEKATIRELKPTATIEIRDLDALTNAEEVATSIRQALQDMQAEMKVNMTKINSREQCRAFVSMAANEANIILGLGRIKIGWTRCRVQLSPEIKRCFKCFGAGHVQANCSGPDRKNLGLCIRCGETGHKLKDCRNSARCCICVQRGSKEIDHLPGSYKCSQRNV